MVVPSSVGALALSWHLGVNYAPRCEVGAYPSLKNSPLALGKIINEEGLPRDWEVRGNCMCKEMPVIPVNRLVDPKRIIGKMEGWGGGEAQGTADPPSPIPPKKIGRVVHQASASWWLSFAASLSSSAADKEVGRLSADGTAAARSSGCTEALELVCRTRGQCYYHYFQWFCL
jgi:hypothetical protein